MTRIQKAVEAVETAKISHDAARKAADYALRAYQTDRTPQSRAAHVAAQQTLDAAAKPKLRAMAELDVALTEAGHQVADMTGDEQLALAKTL